MKAVISPSLARGVISAPPSKSYAHRLLICASLSRNGEVENVELSDDIKATLSCLDKLGFKSEISGKNVKFAGKNSENEALNCLESGSTLRFLIPLALVLKGEAKFIGSEKLFSRGLGVYEDIFKKQNIAYKLDKDCIEIKGKLNPGIYEVDASISSQFITGLLFALPLLDGDSEIHLKERLGSKPYIDITIDVLSRAGIKVIETSFGYQIKGGQHYKMAYEKVEADYSNAAFLDGLNLLGGNVEINNLNPISKQGDKVYRDLYPLLVNGHPVIDLKDAIDLGPILFSLASVFNGATFKNIERLRIKESDRVKDTLDMLSCFGVKYEIKENEVEIYKCELHAPKGEVVPAKDHRLVMSAAILLTKYGGTLANIEAVNKSYPSFFEDLKSLGVEVKYE